MADDDVDDPGRGDDGDRDRGCRQQRHAETEAHLLLAERVADAAHRVDQARLAVCLGLAAQVADVDLERVRRGPEVVAPDAVEDHVARQHLARVAQEQLEQEELGPGQLDRPVAAADLARARVERQVGEREQLVAAGRAAQERAQPREQLLERERLDQVVVGAGVEPGDAVVDLVAGGQHQDRRRVPLAAERAAGLEPVHDRHQHVEHDRVDAAAGEREAAPPGRRRPCSTS